MNDVRKRMLAGEELSECAGCNMRKATVDMVERDHKNIMFADVIPDLLAHTNSDGSLTKPFQMRFMNIRYSNLCNFACRTCGPTNSSLWAKEQKHLIPVVNISDMIPDYVNEIFTHLPTVRVINFAGGETMFMPEVWQVMDQLIAMQKLDVRLNFTTNLSQLTFKDKDLVDYAKMFSGMRIIGSIDCVEERAELYRYGTKWEKVKTNLARIQQNKIPIRINCTIGAMNVWHSPDLEKYLINNKLVSAPVFKGMLTHAEYLSCKILPAWFKQEVAEKIREHQMWLDANNHPSDSWNEVIDFMLLEDHSHLLPKFISYTSELDTLRGENSAMVFPELRKILLPQ